MAHGINLAIGPSCFTRCIGCYNHFANTAVKGGLVSAVEILRFAERAVQLGVTHFTLSGGDPLTHPEIIEIARGLCEMRCSVKLDTVGTAFLGQARMIYYGRGDSPRIRLEDLAPHIESIGLPIDGVSLETGALFRTGRPNLLAEVCAVVSMAKRHEVSVCINTVAHAANLNEIEDIGAIVTAQGADFWQIFEFQPTGPLGSKNAERFELGYGEFQTLERRLEARFRKRTQTRIQCKSRTARQGAYFLVDDGGLAWLPVPDGPERETIGHIVSEIDVVLRKLTDHLARLNVG